MPAKRTKRNMASPTARRSVPADVSSSIAVYRDLWRRLTWVLSLVILLGGAGTAWLSFGWFVPASRAFVREEVTPVSVLALQGQLYTLRASKQAVARDKANIESALHGAKDPAFIALARERISKAEDDGKDIDEKIADVTAEIKRRTHPQ
jgi:hypothetical protein